MRICFLLAQGNMHSGGQGVYLYYVTRELARLGHDVHAIVGPPYPDLAQGVDLHRVETYSNYRLLETDRLWFYGRPPLEAFRPLNLYELASSRAGMFSVMAAFSFRAYGRFRELQAVGPFDLVHDNQCLGYGTLLVKATGVPTVATVHHPLAMDRRNSVREARTLWDQVRAVLFYPFFMQEAVARRLDRIVCVSGKAAGWVRRLFALSEERVAVVPNGVDADFFCPSDEVPRESGRILFVGNARDANKGARYLLEALALLRDEYPVHLVLVGPGATDADPLSAVLAGCGLEGRVRYAGPASRSELVEHYRRSEIAVAPSLFEGFGLPAVEAMACGLPVVATTAGAFPEVVEDGVSGFLMPPADPEALAAALRRLLADPSLRRSMGEAARRRVAERLTWRRSAERLLEVYEQVRAERRRPAEAPVR